MYLNTSQRPSGAFLQGPHLGEPSFEPKPSLHRASSLAQKGAEAREKDLAAGHCANFFPGSRGPEAPARRDLRHDEEQTNRLEAALQGVHLSSLQDLL